MSWLLVKGREEKALDKPRRAMRTTAMQIEFTDLVRRDSMHTNVVTIAYAMLGVALVMQAAVWVPVYRLSVKYINR